MGRLTIKVHGAHLLRPAASGSINPRITINVDKTYRFLTHSRRNTYDPNYDETFVVENTHHLAVMEVSVYHVTQSKGLLPGLGMIMSAGDEERRDVEEVLLGYCYVSIQRLVQGGSKTRTYYLGTTPPKADDNVLSAPPQGVAGWVSLTLETDVLGEAKTAMKIMDSVEQKHANRLKRLLLRYDRSKIPVLDLLLAHVRDPRETLIGGSASAAAAGTYLTLGDDNTTTKSITVGGGEDGLPAITFDQPQYRESFDQLFARLRRDYGGNEPGDFGVSVRVDGCSMVVLKRIVNGLTEELESLYVVCRTEAEDFVTPTVSAHDTVVWSVENTANLDVVNPSSSVVLVVLMGIVSGRHCEIGRTTVSVAPLAVEHESFRHMFVCDLKEITAPAIVGNFHLSLLPCRFGLTPMELVDHVDLFYDRLSMFFRRYDPVRVPFVDMLIHARLGELEELMELLVLEHGREPGTVKLSLTVDEVKSLMVDVDEDLHRVKVVVLITMGSVTVRSRPMKAKRFISLKFEETFVFDVVRETDMIRICVVKANDPSVVYGRIDFTCLHIQRGAKNVRNLFLVGRAGTSEAFFSGVVAITLYSEELGNDYEVDVRTQRMYLDRLRRYVYRRLPRILHRVHLAVATVFDMDTFLARMAAQYGEEDTTYDLFFTVLGCRQLKMRFGGVDPYVVVRVGVDTYRTKVVHHSTEPDYFECCEFTYDRPDYYILLVVMDSSEMGTDREIGRAVIPLAEVEISRQYHDFIPLYAAGKKHPTIVGTIGFKYTVVDTRIVDRTRTRLIMQKYGRNHQALSVVEKSQQRVEAAIATNSGAAADLSSLGGGAPAGGWSNWVRFRNPADKRRAAGATTASSLNSLGRSSVANSGVTSESDGEEPTDANSIFSMLNGDHTNPTINLMNENIIDIDDFCVISDNNSATSSVIHTDDDESGVGVLQRCLIHPSTVSTRRDDAPHDDHLHHDTTKRLRVRVVQAKDLHGHPRNPPNPYVLLSTINETHRSRVRFGSTSPTFNEEFVFTIDEPNTDLLSITVATDTPYGVSKLGHCVLSLKNIQRDVTRTRWVSLVLNSHLPSAVEEGSICLTLSGEHFGLDYLPSEDAENRLRERAREFLQRAQPHQLHCLEWYIGEYSLKEDAILHRLFDATAITGESGRQPFGIIHLGIRHVSHLSGPNGLLEGTCVVQLKVRGRLTAETDSMVGQRGFFDYNESFEIHLQNPGITPLKIVVRDKKRGKVGQCFISVADLHKGITQQRTHALVVEHPDPRPSGFITVSILSTNYGSTAAAPTPTDELRYTRLRNFLMYYVPEELSTASVKYASTLNINAYLQELVNKHGPEPGEYPLTLTVGKCGYFVTTTASSSINAFCVVRCGMKEYRSSIVDGLQDFLFQETFDLIVGLPDREKLELTVMEFSPSKSRELGRTRIPLRNLRQGATNAMRLPLVMDLGTKHAATNGYVEISLFTNAFGLSEELARNTTAFFPPAAAPGLSRTPSLFPTHSDGNTTLAHVEVMTNLGGESVSADPQSLAAGDSAAAIPDDSDVTSVRVSILGFSDWTLPEDELIYLRIKFQDKVLLLTKTMTVDEARQLTDVTFELKDASILHQAVFTLKIATRGFFRSETICLADFCLSRSPHGCISHKYLKLYSLDYQFVGLCRLQVEVPKLANERGEWEPFPATAAEAVLDDLTSLVMQYSPKDLRRLDLALYRCVDVRRLHRSMRQQLAPAVVATVYVVLDDIHLVSSGLELQMRMQRCASVSVDEYTSEVMQNQSLLSSYSRGSSRVAESYRRTQLPWLRADVGVTGKDALLTIRIMNRVGKKLSKEVGRAVVSLRALLTPRVFEMSELQTVPLVAVRRALNSARASFVGTLSFYLMPLSFESYPSSLRFSSSVVGDDFSRAYVRYYHTRIERYLKHYDANSLVDLHANIYENIVATRNWRDGLPQYLEMLISRWGPEKDAAEPVPPLT